MPLKPPKPFRVMVKVGLPPAWLPRANPLHTADSCAFRLHRITCKPLPARPTRTEPTPPNPSANWEERLDGNQPRQGVRRLIGGKKTPLRNTSGGNPHLCGRRTPLGIEGGQELICLAFQRRVSFFGSLLSVYLNISLAVRVRDHFS